MPGTGGSNKDLASGPNGYFIAEIILLTIEWLGTIDYLAAWDQQKILVAEREQDSSLDDHLLLLEHPPTYTLGRHGRIENLLLDETTRRQKGIALHRVDRGGDITYHGPGQLVGYPILYLERYYGRGIGRIRRYITDLEEMLISLLAVFDISARRLQDHRGVWVETEQGLDKIAAVGIRVNAKGISSHGFALNVNPDLNYFKGIIPCGISDHGVTTMSQILGQSLSPAELLPHIRKAFSTIFDVETNSVGEWPEPSGNGEYKPKKVVSCLE